MIKEITPLIITYDEAPNIARTLDRLIWAKRIVVIDSGSTDRTIDIVRSYPQADLIHRPFDDFASQCNFGIAQVTTPWILSLDADYELSDELVNELGNLQSRFNNGGLSSEFCLLASMAGHCAGRFIPRGSSYTGGIKQSTGIQGMATA